MAEFDLTVKDEDKIWLRSNYSALNFSFGQDGVLELSGPLNFRMLPKKDKSGYVINPLEEHLALGNPEDLIEDRYLINIRFEKGKKSGVPKVFETDSRIESSVEKWKKKSKADVHLYEDDSCCLCVKMEEKENLPNGFNLPDFFNNLVIPFFYAQSYFESVGEWPWGEYSHGVLGGFEWYYNEKKGELSKEEMDAFIDFLKENGAWGLVSEALSRGVREDGRCPACKRKKVKGCHKIVLLSMWKMKKNFRN